MSSPEPALLRPARILVVGTSGAGKSTLATALAARLGIPDIELDDLFWKPAWTPSTNEEFCARIERALAENPEWIINGNYGQARPLTWPRATHLIWLDYSFALTFTRAFRRTIHRYVARTELWSAKNRESLYTSFCTKDSILWWVITTWKKRRREYPELLARPEYAHLRKLRFRSPRETERFLASLLPAEGGAPSTATPEPNRALASRS